MRHEMLGGIVGGGLIVFVVLTWPHGLMRFGPPRLIRAYLLQQTPVGSHVSDVERWVVVQRGQEADLPRVSPPTPPFLGAIEPPPPGYTFAREEGIATYKTPRPREVRATYTFDREGHLLDIQVRRAAGGGS